jgi:hypothetical protein
MFVMAIMFFLIVAIIVLAIQYTRGRRAFDQEIERTRRKQQQIVGLSQTLKTAEAELARKREIAEQIPLITRKLTQKLSQESLPAVAIRSAMEFFHARQVGYFVPIEGSLRLHPQGRGWLLPGLARKVRISSDEHSWNGNPEKKWSLRKLTRSPLPAGDHRNHPMSNPVWADFVAVFGVSGIVGVLVIAGALFLDEGRKYVSMLVDILSTTLQNAVGEYGQNQHIRSVP